MNSRTYRVLTCNSHEAYVSALAEVAVDLDIIDGLPGRYTQQWDTRIRPIPAGARLISIKQALAQREQYDCFVGHSIDDLMLVKQVKIPKILVLHVSLYGYLAQENNQLTPHDIQLVLRTYLDQIKATVVAISALKRESWGLEGQLIAPYIDTSFFQGYMGILADGLRVVNQFTAKSRIIAANLHNQLAGINPIRIVGVNPDLPHANPARDMNELRDIYRQHRYYVHTATPDYEDGYNLASLEAMAVGLPVVSNAHYSTPVINGVSGIVSNDVGVLRAGILDLVNDRDLAAHYGDQARRYVIAHHSLAQFTTAWLHAIQSAILKF